MRAALLLARTDLRVLTRSRGLIVALVAYPLVLSLIVGGLLLHQGPPRIGFVNEDLTGDTLTVGEREFSLDDYVRRARTKGVEIVDMDQDEARRALDEGQVAGVLVIPQGTIATLRTQLSGAKLRFMTGDNPLGDVVAQRIRGVVYDINLSISDALVDANRSYLERLVTGGDVEVAGDEYSLYGLEPVEADLRAARAELAGGDAGLLERLDRAIEFADVAGTAIGLADNALEATAAPIRLDVRQEQGTSPLLTAQAMGFALAVSIAFTCIVLTGASLAGEREDAVLGRMLRGLASGVEIVAGKLLVGVLVAAALGFVLFVSFSVLSDHAWSRLPLLLAAVAVAGFASSAIGALLAVLTRDARSATLLGVLLVLPLAPLALVSLDAPLAWLEAVTPIAPARALFNAVLFERDPWQVVLHRGAQLTGIGIVAAAGAARMVRRLA